MIMDFVKYTVIALATIAIVNRIQTIRNLLAYSGGLGSSVTGNF